MFAHDLILIARLGTIEYVSRAKTQKNSFLKVEASEPHKGYKEYTTHMPIAIEFVSSRRKKIAVDVVPAEWQLYIAH